jgi:hypothetical protein
MAMNLPEWAQVPKEPGSLSHAKSTPEARNCMADTVDHLLPLDAVLRSGRDAFAQ